VRLDLNLLSAFNCLSEVQPLINSFQEQPVSAPSRSPEIRRRRTRKEKIIKLRKRLAAADSESDRSRIIAKLERLGRNSPGQPLVKS
jgi:hypothetical protein